MTRNRPAPPTPCAPSPLRLTALDGIVNDYIERYRENSRRLSQFYRSRRRLDEAIEFAAHARLPSGKRHPHQYRLRRVCIDEAHRRLRGLDFSGFTDFAQLHEAVHLAVGDVRGLGELYVYDTAVRLGAFLGFKPECVYLHSGTRVGAKALGLGTGRRATLEMNELPAPFRRLSPDGVEDCLCIYKDVLARAGEIRSVSRRVPRPSRARRC